MKDRIPGRPGRVKITLDDKTEIEGVISLADDPEVEGSLYNKGNVLPDDTCTLLELDTEAAEPKDAFEHAASSEHALKIGEVITTERTMSEAFVPIDGRYMSSAAYPDLYRIMGVKYGFTRLLGAQIFATTDASVTYKQNGNYVVASFGASASYPSLKVINLNTGSVWDVPEQDNTRSYRVSADYVLTNEKLCVKYTDSKDSRRYARYVCYTLSDGAELWASSSVTYTSPSSPPSPYAFGDQIYIGDRNLGLEDLANPGSFLSLDLSLYISDGVKNACPFHGDFLYNNNSTICRLQLNSLKPQSVYDGGYSAGYPFVVGEYAYVAISGKKLMRINPNFTVEEMTGSGTTLDGPIKNVHQFYYEGGLVHLDCNGQEMVFKISGKTFDLVGKSAANNLISFSACTESDSVSMKNELNVHHSGEFQFKLPGSQTSPTTYIKALRSTAP